MIVLNSKFISFHITFPADQILFVITLVICFCLIFILLHSSIEEVCVFCFKHRRYEIMKLHIMQCVFRCAVHIVAYKIYFHLIYCWVHFASYGARLQGAQRLWKLCKHEIELRRWGEKSQQQQVKPQSKPPEHWMNMRCLLSSSVDIISTQIWRIVYVVEILYCLVVCLYVALWASSAATLVLLPFYTIILLDLAIKLPPMPFDATFASTSAVVSNCIIVILKINCKRIFPNIWLAIFQLIERTFEQKYRI